MPATAMHHDGMKTYQLIGMNTQNNPDLADLQLQIYSKDNAENPQQRELHGNLVLSTIGLPDKSKISTGFLFRMQNSQEEKWDGLSVQVDYDHANRAFPEFRHSDLEVTGKPDSMDIFSNDSSGSNDWQISGSKSSIKCDMVGDCTFTIHF
jgi:hypothetical protein